MSGSAAPVRIPRVLTIASSDSGGGAGIQADLKAFARCGAYGMSAIVALTAQNTVGVTAIHELPPAFVRAQIDAVLDDIGADAAKTGMLFSTPLIQAVADALAPRDLPLVVDPVMVASSGSRLLMPDAVGTLIARLFPLASVVTPNLIEAQALTEIATEDRAKLAEALVAMGARAALVTGGHGTEPVDHLFDGARHLPIPVTRFPVAATHGAGCTHSAALAAGLAAGLSLADAAQQAAAVAGDAVAHGLSELGGGEGPVHVLHHLAACRNDLTSLSAQEVSEPTGLLGGHAEQGLAVELVAGHDGQAAAGLGPGSHVLLALLRACRWVEDRSWTRLEGRLPVDLDEQQPVQEHVHLAVRDGPVGQHRSGGQVLLAEGSRDQDAVGQGAFHSGPGRCEEDGFPGSAPGACRLLRPA
jgi:hydroxymethylpyrimidine/phosphomethylpyrimidine kinase